MFLHVLSSARPTMACTRNNRKKKRRPLRLQGALQTLGLTCVRNPSRKLSLGRTRYSQERSILENDRPLDHPHHGPLQVSLVPGHVCARSKTNVVWLCLELWALSVPTPTVEDTKEANHLVSDFGNLCVLVVLHEEPLAAQLREAEAEAPVLTAPGREGGKGAGRHTSRGPRRRRSSKGASNVRARDRVQKTSRAAAGCPACDGQAVGGDGMGRERA